MVVRWAPWWAMVSRVAFTDKCQGIIGIEAANFDFLGGTPAEGFLDGVWSLTLGFDEIWFVDAGVVVVKIENSVLTTESVRHGNFVSISTDKISSGGDCGAMIFGANVVGIRTQAGIAG